VAVFFSIILQGGGILETGCILESGGILEYLWYMNNEPADLLNLSMVVASAGTAGAARTGRDFIYIYIWESIIASTSWSSTECMKILFQKHSKNCGKPSKKKFPRSGQLAVKVTS
jgi:hypothetical protein